MKFWFDCEFFEDGKTIELISIGMVAEDGRDYYAETFRAGMLCYRSDWLMKNVKPHLTGAMKRPVEIATDLIEFCGEKPEFWGYCSAYDWVCLCQLYGSMIQLPQGWPYFCRDISQMHDGLPDFKLPPYFKPQHNALVDARWTKEAWNKLIDTVLELDDE